MPDFVHSVEGVLVFWGDTLAEVHLLVLVLALERCLELKAYIDQVLGDKGDHHGWGLLGLGHMSAPAEKLDLEGALLGELVLKVGIVDDALVDLPVVGLNVVACMLMPVDDQLLLVVLDG